MYKKMAYSFRDKYKILSKEDFIKLSKIFEVHDTEADGIREIDSIIEHVKVVPDDKNGKIIRKDGKGFSKSTTSNISDKYYIVSSSQILDSLFKAEFFENFAEKINYVKFDEAGGFEVIFSQEDYCDYDVVDISVYAKRSNAYSDSYTMTKNKYGTYRNALYIRNSYDKSRTFAIIAGLSRSIYNGYTTYCSLVEDERTFGTKRILHLNHNKEKIVFGITESINRIPIIANDKNTIHLLHNFALTDEIKNAFKAEIDKWTDERVKAVSKTNGDYYKLIRNVVINKALPLMENALDFANVLSYFKNEDNFGQKYVAGIANTYEVRLKKILGKEEDE